MELTRREWLPKPDRLPVALLIHGMGGSGQTWWRVAEHLTDLGYRVVAPDLAGHGDSPRAEKYSVNNWVQGVMEVLQDYPEPQLIVGHSLGGLVATGVAQRLTTTPLRVILIDPAWVIPAGAPANYIIGRTLGHMRTFTHASMHRSKPTWSGKDINLELAAIKKWDPRTTGGLNARETKQILRTYLRSKIPTTLVRPNGSIMVVGPWAWLLTKRHGIEVISMRKVGHNLHRDDPTGFVSLLAERIVPAAS